MKGILWPAKPRGSNDLKNGTEMVSGTNARSGESTTQWNEDERPLRRELRDDDMGPSLEDPSMTTQSFATTRSEKILEDIISCQYECAICHDDITLSNKMWACEECHHVYHFDCIMEWSSRRTLGNWACPTCNREDHETPQARCWCRKHPHSEDLNAGNCCGEICGNVRSCASSRVYKCRDTCKKICHPGPCEPPVCSPTCDLVKRPKVAVNALSRQSTSRTRQAVLNLSANMRENTQQVNAERTEYNVLRTSILQIPHRPRWRLRGSGRAPRANRPNADGPTFSQRWAAFNDDAAIRCFIWFLFSNAGFAIWVAFNTHFLIEPLENPNFTESSASTLVSLLFGIIVTIGLAGANIIFWEGIISFTTRELNRPSLSFMAGFMKGYLKLLAFAIFFGCVWWFPIAFFAAPPLKYYHQMRNSCEGFDTRATLSSYDYAPIEKGTISLYNPAINPGDMNHPFGLDDFDIYGTTTEGLNRMDPWRAYIRLLGQTDQPIAVDFDLSHYKWRMISFRGNGTDAGSGNLIKNGTWSSTTREQPHAFLPELDLVITNLYQFSKSCQYQPYITVFKTQGMKRREIARQENKKWSPKSQGNVVMRTASFGHSINAIQACGRRQDYVAKKGGIEEIRQGLGNDMLVPMGILAVLGRQMRIDGKYTKECDWYSIASI